MGVDTTVCRKVQGQAEEGNTCLQTPGTCESCPGWVEDYPGQADEIRRDRLIRKAVETADRIICKGADGSTEEIDYLTAQVALKFAEKAANSSSRILRAKEMLARTK